MNVNAKSLFSLRTMWTSPQHIVYELETTLKADEAASAIIFKNHGNVVGDFLASTNPPDHLKPLLVIHSADQRIVYVPNVPKELPVFFRGGIGSDTNGDKDEGLAIWEDAVALFPILESVDRVPALLQ